MPSQSLTVIGNLTKDPNLQVNGTTRCTFTLACNQRYRDASGTWQDAEPTFLDVICWGDLAEHVAASLTKGTRVIVSGALRQRTWTTDEGQKRSRLEVSADDVGPSLRWTTATANAPDKPAQEVQS